MRRDQPLTTGASHTVGGGRPGGGRGGDEEGRRNPRGNTENGALEVSESGSYIRGSQVGRGPHVQPRTAGGGGGGGGGGRRDEAVDCQVREASGSILSQRSDYVDNSDVWVSRDKDGQPRTIIIPLTRQPIPGGRGGGEEEMAVPGDPEDYVDMKAISSADRYLGLVRRDYRGLADVPEEDADPADYEHPLSSERAGEISQVEEGRQDHRGPRVAHKGGVLPSLSNAVAMPGRPGGATGGGVLPVKRYINVEVKEFDPSMDMFCSSEHHKDTMSHDSNNPPAATTLATTVAEGEDEDDRDKAQKRHHDYINIDGEKLPPENPPIPKNGH